MVFYQTPALEVTACVMLSNKAVYLILHDGLRRYFSEPLQGRYSSLAAPGSGPGEEATMDLGRSCGLSPSSERGVTTALPS